MKKVRGKMYTYKLNFQELADSLLPNPIRRKRRKYTNFGGHHDFSQISAAMQQYHQIGFLQKINFEQKFEPKMKFDSEMKFQPEMKFMPPKC